MHEWKIETGVAITVFVLVAFGAATNVLAASPITYMPYLQPGDVSAFGSTDQMVVAWQTKEPNPSLNAYVVEFGTTEGYGNHVATSARMVDNYLAADPSLPIPPTAPGPYANYAAVLGGLHYDTTYHYRVSGPGLPVEGFRASFHTRKRHAHFSFQVMGDEGSFPGVPGSNPARLANYEARIINEMFNVHNLIVPGAPRLTKPDLALNTGDNVYTTGSEGNYRDFWFPVWNSDVASNETGAPYIRNIPYYIVAGNHDIGATGATANLLADDSAGRFSGNTDGGDALGYFNNFYFPLNGPTGVDPQYVFNGDLGSPTGWFFKYKGVSYTSPAAIEALRASTEVDAGRGKKRQIDTMGNYSFDYGTAHFVFLDANPHLFNSLLPGGPIYQVPPTGFPAYPGILREWLIHDLDASHQPWKIVVYHQPAFSSGNATLRNNQMRSIAKVLEDHGVNLVFNGHEHNYQRTHPLRVIGDATAVPTLNPGPVLAADTGYDGMTKTVPDGVIYVVEGAGGNRDFDDNLPSPRGGGAGIDQDDSAGGNFSFGPGLVFPQGTESWLDDRLTNTQMTAFLSDAGSRTKITARFKSKVFSFGQVDVGHNVLTLYQISEPLSGKSSATFAVPAPFGTDVNGVPLTDPIPDTLVDPATGGVVSAAAIGQPALLDTFTVVKPDLEDRLSVKIKAPRRVSEGALLTYRVLVHNRAPLALNGTQAVVKLPARCGFAGAVSDTLTLHGRDVVATVGRLEKGASRAIDVVCQVRGSGKHDDDDDDDDLVAAAEVRSATALTVRADEVVTRIRENH